MNKEITKISSMLNKEIWNISWVLYITNNFCTFSLSFCFWKCQYSWRKNPLNGVRSFIYPKYIYVTSILLVRHGFGINWLHLVQSDWFEMPLTFQWPFIWHQLLLCRERCFHWQVLVLLNSQQDVIYPHAMRLLFVPLKVGTPAGHPRNPANLNFPVLSRDIYRWEFWQEQVSVFEGILLLIAISVFSLWVSKRWK